VAHHPAHPPDIYWSATRIVPGTINEFPAFSLLFADLHAHVMAMPLASATLVLACQIALGSGEQSRQSTADDPDTPGLTRSATMFPSVSNANGSALRSFLSSSRDTAGRFALEAGAAGFLVSALYATNTWDFPTYLGLLVGAFAIREFLAVEWRISYRLLVRVGLWAIATVAAGRLFFWPFYTSFFPESGVVRQPERTPVASYLTIHGLFIVALAGFVAQNLAQRLTMSRSVIQLPGTAGIVAEPAPISTGASTGRPTSAAGPGIMAAAVAVVLAGIWRDELSVVLVGALIIMALAGWTCRNDPGRLLVILFAATALALGLATEQVALKGDIGRMNTVFKLSLQAWMLFGIAAAVGSVIVWTSGERRSLPVRIWTVTLGVLVAGAAVYPIIAVPARTHDRFVPMPTMLNGMTYMNGAVYTDAPDGRPEVRFPLSNDLAAIDWLRANIDGSPVVLEATIPEYRWGSRVSIYTGLPTVLGWNWHETQQRPGFGMMLEERRTDVQRMLGETTSFDSIRPLLDKYHVRLIYIGDLERAYYDATALAKFEAAAQDGELSIIYRGPGVTIYEYPDVPG
jgi:YYY domain-containing protein